MYIDAQWFLSLVAIVTGIGVFIGIFVRIHKFVLRQDTLEERINALETKEQDDTDTLAKIHDKEFDEVQRELQIITYAVLACLKCLSKQPCENDNIQETISVLEKHINEKAHS